VQRFVEFTRLGASLNSNVALVSMLWYRDERKNVTEKSSPVAYVEGKPTVGSEGSTGGVISTRELIEPIFMKTVLISLIATLLFAYLGSSNILAPFDAQAQRLVSLLSWIWPTLPIQYKLVRQVQGVGQSASNAFMCAALWAWPIGCAVAFLRGHAKSQKKVLSISPKETGQFFVALPIGFIFLVYDVTEVDSPLFGFPVNYPILIYLRQWFVFGATAIVLGSLLYVIGRILLERIWRRSL
jgi:hypothetical protein